MVVNFPLHTHISEIVFCSRPWHEGGPTGQLDSLPLCAKKKVELISNVRDDCVRPARKLRKNLRERMRICSLGRTQPRTGSRKRKFRFKKW